MEWSDIYEPTASDSYLLSSLTPQFEVDDQQYSKEWTFEENKLFENALAEFGPDSPAFFEYVASRLPCKSMKEIRRHYDSLLEDVEMIEAGLLPIPNYVNTEGSEGENNAESSSKNDQEKGSPSTKPARRTCPSHLRRKSVPWTEEEHKLFLMGLNKYGKGDWRSISRYYVVTKTPTQVASHAQKFYRRQTSNTPIDRRRPSIHDIQTVSSSFLPMPDRRNELLQLPVPMPNLYDANYGMVPEHNNNHFATKTPVFPPGPNNNFNGCELPNFAAETLVFPPGPNNNFNGYELNNFATETPNFPQGPSAFPMANSIINQPTGAYPHPSYQFPYPMNYP
ncbi:hypothetical protein ACSBR1_009628 [Camellia fascicularis]